jgi:hypothetical protein
MSVIIDLKEERKTAGELQHQILKDQTKYNPVEAGMSFTQEIVDELGKCIDKHNKIFNEDEYFLVMQLAGDPLLVTVIRRKFYADLYLPDPRPRQSVFLYSKKQQRVIKFLWALPDVEAMEVLTEMGSNVHPAYQRMQVWCKAFYAGSFWTTIRKENGISHLSKSEYLNTHRAELIEASGKEVEVLRPDTFDFSKVMVHKVIDSQKPLLDKAIL